MMEEAPGEVGSAAGAASAAAALTGLAELAWARPKAPLCARVPWFPGEAPPCQPEGGAGRVKATLLRPCGISFLGDAGP